MQKRLVWYGSVVFIYCCTGLVARTAIVPCYSGGRLGDNLLSVAHAAYFSFKYNLELLVPSFSYLDQFRLGSTCKRFSEEVLSNYTESLTLQSLEQLNKNVASNTVFLLPYFPEKNAFVKADDFPKFSIDWEYPGFIMYLKKLLAPAQKLSLITPMPGKVSVAVHVRKGGTYADEAFISSGVDMDRLCSNSMIYKMPLDQFYINQLKMLTKLFPKTEFYVFLFTDHTHPARLVRKYGTFFKDGQITLRCREGKHDYDCHVLEDFFSQMQFDVLIRPESNFSIVAEKLGNHTLVITPGAFLPGTKIQRGQFCWKKGGHIPWQ